MKSIKVGLLGLGTVGSGVVAVLGRNQREITGRLGCSFEITHAAVRRLDPARVAGTEIQLTTDAAEIVNHPEIEMVVELMGGVDLARQYVLKAIENGKHVVTANKALIALHGDEIFAAAKARGVMVAYEAAVAGGIPIIKAIREGLAANHIQWVAGIINGTCNYILTEMRNQGRSFAEALADAQKLGYAEADPEFDVEGIDAAHKLTILASIAFGIPLQFDKLHIEGVSQVSLQDLQYAEEFGYAIKHLGVAKQTAEGVELRVHPTLVPMDNIIANVNGVMNAVMVNADAVGTTFYYGAGAGSEPTASAVVADMVDVARGLQQAEEARVPYNGFSADALTAQTILPIEEIDSAYYLRMQALDKPGVMAQVSNILGDAGISIEAIVQKEPVNGGNDLPVLMLTHRVKEKAINAVVAKIEKLDVITSPVTRIRVEHFNH